MQNSKSNDFPYPNMHKHFQEVPFPLFVVILFLLCECVSLKHLNSPLNRISIKLIIIMYASTYMHGNQEYIIVFYINLVMVNKYKM